MRAIWADIRYGIRSLSRTWPLTAISILVLGFGIGAATALFTLTNSVLLRPLAGVKHPEALVQFARFQNGQEFGNASYPDYVDLRNQSRSFDGLIAERAIPVSFAHGVTERLAGDIVSGNYFEVLSVLPAAGRLLTPEDDRIPGSHPVAVISHALWQRAFAGDPSAVGQKILLNGYAFTLIGVAPSDFAGLNVGESTDIWLPMMMQREAMPRNAGSGMLSSRSAGWLSIYGRLRHGTSIQSAQADVTNVARGLERTYPETNTGRSMAIAGNVGLASGHRKDLQRILGILLGSVIVLLLIACQNAANLFLVRTARRRKEIAIRIAIGAGRLALIRQLFIECSLVCAGALSLALLSLPLLVSLALYVLGASDPAFRAARQLDGTVLTFAALITLGTAFLFSVAPALQGSRADVFVALKSAAPVSMELRRGRTPRLATVLVIGQVALSTLLLIASGLLLRTMTQILSVDRGFETKGVLLAAADLAIQRYSEQQGKQFTEQLLSRLAALPAVESASVSKSEPARDWSDRVSVFQPGQEPPAGELRAHPGLGLLADANRVSPGYFSTLGMTIMDGRDFSWLDRNASPRVAIVSEALARKMWPNQRAIGNQISIPDASGGQSNIFEVIGVARDAKYRSILLPAPLLLYTPWMQMYDSFLTLEIKTRTDSWDFARQLRQEVATLDPALPLYNVRTLNDQVARSLWQQRSAAILIGGFGTIALVLSTMGLYTQLAQSVVVRKREIGIRMALGADASIVMRGILRQGMLLSLLGASIGLAIALSSGRFVQGLLYGITARDPLSLGAALAVLIAVAIPACYFPARTATKVDPMIALRQD